MPSIYLHVPPIGIDESDGFTYRGDRPASHCKICGDSFQPWLARTPEYDYDGEIRLAVEIELKEWRDKHNRTHSEAEHLALIESGNMMTPEAALKLIPLGIYPIQDLAMNDEVAQAGRESKAMPNDDVPYR